MKLKAVTRSCCLISSLRGSSVVFAGCLRRRTGAGGGPRAGRVQFPLGSLDYFENGRDLVLIAVATIGAVSTRRCPRLPFHSGWPVAATTITIGTEKSRATKRGPFEEENTPRLSRPDVQSTSKLNGTAVPFWNGSHKVFLLSGNGSRHPPPPAFADFPR